MYREDKQEKWNQWEKNKNDHGWYKEKKNNKKTRLCEGQWAYKKKPTV